MLNGKLVSFLVYFQGRIFIHCNKHLQAIDAAKVGDHLVKRCLQLIIFSNIRPRMFGVSILFKQMRNFVSNY